ncbi:hypothetical protein N7486_007196 [Penicillium sp. IBT 16267x]|nr:hypothetical protein N7486_007196 [Penicillium sp. IBT 16267x]
MSRNFIPAALAIGVGVLTGYYAFQPALQALAVKEAHSRVPGSSSDAPATKKDTSIPVNDHPVATPNPGAPEPESSK